MKSQDLATAAVALAGIAVGATLVRTVTFGETSNAGYSSSAASPAPQSTGEYVFACVSKSGKVDYLEFRSPLPHQCWFSGETLWHFAALPAVQASPSAAPTSSPAAAQASASSSSSASASASASASPSAPAAS